MKRLLLSMIMLGAVLWAVEPWTGVCGPVPWWVKDNIPTQSGYKYRGICVINDSLVWVVGENGNVWKRVGGVHSHEWVQVTIDVITQTDYHFNDVFFIGNHGWIVGEKRAEPDKYKGIVVWTTDGGSSWYLPTTTPSFPLPTPFLKVKMANVDRGYISCGNGTILATTDGGVTWERRPCPWDNPAHPGDSISVWYNGLWVDPNNPNNLWVSGDAFGILAKSNDGGASWMVSETNVFDTTYTFPPSTSTPYGTKLGFFDIDFANPNVGYVAFSYGKIGKTTDGGISWTVNQYEPQPTWFYDVFHIGTDNFAGGNYGVIHRFDGAHNQENVNYRWLTDNGTTNFKALDAQTTLYTYGCGDGSCPIRQRYDPGDFSITDVSVEEDTMRYKITIEWDIRNPENIQGWRIKRYAPKSYLFRRGGCNEWNLTAEARACTTYIPYAWPFGNYYYTIEVFTNDIPYQECAAIKIDSTLLDSLTNFVFPAPPNNVSASDVLMTREIVLRSPGTLTLQIL